MDVSRFDADAQKYAAYLASTKGRLRSDVSWFHLRSVLPPPAESGARNALDLGGGDGAVAVRLAKLGYRVTLLDNSEAMLALAERAALAAGVGEMIALQRADASLLSKVVPAGYFDVIACHNVLEYLTNPLDALHAMRRALKAGPQSVVSILVRNRAGEVFKAALESADLALADKNLTAQWATESLYGGEIRVFNPADLRTSLATARLQLLAERGVRILADYLPAHLLNDEKSYPRVLALEQKLGTRPEFAGVARYAQFLARALAV